MARRSVADDETVTAWRPVSPRSGRIERPYDLDDSAVNALLDDLEIEVSATLPASTPTMAAEVVARSSFTPPPIPSGVVEQYFRPQSRRVEPEIAQVAIPSLELPPRWDESDAFEDGGEWNHAGAGNSIPPEDPASTEEGTLFLVNPVRALPPPPMPAPAPPPVFVAPVVVRRTVSAPQLAHLQRRHAPTVRTTPPRAKRAPLVAVGLLGFFATLATLIAGWQLATARQASIAAPIDALGEEQLRR